MVTIPNTMISAISPDSFRIHAHFKVVELIISLETKLENSNTLITLYEYLIADDTACIIFNTQSELEIDATYEIKDGHSQIIEGYLRLYSNQVEPSLIPIKNELNTGNNRSLEQFERKV